MSTTIVAAKTMKSSWNAFADVDAFVDSVLAELSEMKIEGVRIRSSGPRASMDDVALRKAIMAIWCVCFCGMQWRAIGTLTGIPFGTLYSLFSRWTRLGLWNRLMLRLSVAWRVACGDDPMPSSLVIDSRSCRSAPSCGFRGIDGGKKIRGVKFHVATDNHGSPFAVDVGHANEHDAKGIRPTIEELSELGFAGGALGAFGYSGDTLDEFAKSLGLLGVVAVAGGRGGIFVPTGIRWVVERTFAWASRYRRLNVIFERKAEHMVAFFELMAVSILSRRLARLVKS